ncbi:MAG: metallophosphoesterase [Alphaproteobacteria bacterium]
MSTSLDQGGVTPLYGAHTPAFRQAHLNFVANTNAPETQGSDKQYSIINFSDVHFPLKQSDAAHLYEMLHHVHQSGGADVIVRNGDWFDGWEGEGKEFTEMQKCVIDIMNRMKEKHGTIVIDTEGNHNDRQMEEGIAQKGSDIGMQIAPGVFIETPKEKAIIVHGHQFDSQIVQQDILEAADDEYRRLSRDGAKRDTDMASQTKKTTKTLLSALGYDKSYAYAGHKYGVDRVVIGHRHLPEDKIISPHGALRTAYNSLKNKITGTSDESISDIGKRLADTFGDSVGNTARKLTLQFLMAHGKKIVDGLSQKHVNKTVRSAALVLKDMGYQKPTELMNLIDSKPNTDLLDKINIKGLRPSYYNDKTEEQKTNPRPIKLTDAGSWIDGNTTFCAYNSQGDFELVDWREKRNDLDYKQAANEQTLTDQHHKQFGSFLKTTHQEIDYYKDDVTGYLDREKREEQYRLPSERELARVTLDQNGKVRVEMNGQIVQPSATPDQDKDQKQTAPEIEYA